MSEFTDGLLILKSHAPLAQAALDDLWHPYIFIELDTHWTALTFEDPDLLNETIYPWILRQSRAFPMLYFYHAEDHGWGYRLFHGGQVKDALHVNYNIAEDMMFDLAEQLYPGVDPYNDLSFETMQRLFKQVLESEAYERQVGAQYDDLRLHELSVLGLSPERMQQLDHIMQAEWYETDVNGLSQVEAFQEVLGIEEMSWISYHYLSREENEEDRDD